MCVCVSEYCCSCFQHAFATLAFCFQSVEPVTGKCEALFDFDTTNVGELNFKCGEIIVTTEWIGEEWMYGRIDDREGMFPNNFVKVLKELPKPKDELVDSGKFLDFRVSLFACYTVCSIVHLCMFK